MKLYETRHPVTNEKIQKLLPVTWVDDHGNPALINARDLSPAFQPWEAEKQEPPAPPPVQRAQRKKKKKTR